MFSVQYIRQRIQRSLVFSQFLQLISYQYLFFSETKHLFLAFFQLCPILKISMIRFHQTCKVFLPAILCINIFICFSDCLLQFFHLISKLCKLIGQLSLVFRLLRNQFLQFLHLLCIVIVTLPADFLIFNDLLTFEIFFVLFLANGNRLFLFANLLLFFFNQKKQLFFIQKIFIKQHIKANAVQGNQFSATCVLLFSNLLPYHNRYRERGINTSRLCF